MLKKSLIVIFIALIGGGAIFYSNPDLFQKLMDKTESITSYSLKTPDTRKQVQLIKNHLYDFAISVKEKDMSLFYNHISPFWQQKTSIEELNKVFAPFIKSGIDLTVLKNQNPIIDHIEVTKAGILHMAGHYNTKPSVLYFKQAYRMEKNGEWKLVEFFIELKKKK